MTHYAPASGSHSIRKVYGKKGPRYDVVTGSPRTQLVASFSTEAEAVAAVDRLRKKNPMKKKAMSMEEVIASIRQARTLNKLTSILNTLLPKGRKIKPAEVAQFGADYFHILADELAPGSLEYMAALAAERRAAQIKADAMKTPLQRKTARMTGAGTYAGRIGEAMDREENPRARRVVPPLKDWHTFANNNFRWYARNDATDGRPSDMHYFDLGPRTDARGRETGWQVSEWNAGGGGHLPVRYFNTRNDALRYVREKMGDTTPEKKLIPVRTKNPGDVHIDIHSHNTGGKNVRAKNPARPSRYTVGDVVRVNWSDTPMRILRVEVDGDGKTNYKMIRATADTEKRADGAWYSTNTGRQLEGRFYSGDGIIGKVKGKRANNPVDPAIKFHFGQATKNRHPAKAPQHVFHIKARKGKQSGWYTGEDFDTQRTKARAFTDYNAALRVAKQLAPKLDGWTLEVHDYVNRSQRKKNPAGNLTVEKVFDGGYTISAVIDGQLVRERYKGYSKKEAVASFKRKYMKG